MIDQNCLLTIILVVLISLVMASGAAGANYLIAKPGCQDDCGGVKIPFPFGIGGDCYNNDTRYKIKCDKADPIPVMVQNNRTVLNISLEDHSLRVSSRVAYQCYNAGNPVPSSSPKIDVNTYTLDDMFFFNISGTRNMLVGIGCDTTARVSDGESQGLKDSVGCITSCESEDQARSGTCSSRGCCATSIFNTMQSPDIRAGSMSNYTEVTKSNECSVAFISEAINGSYAFSVSSLKAPPTYYDSMRVPVVYNWFIQSRGCSEATKGGAGESPYLCGSNTLCVDGNMAYGYRCQCKEGYTGNPYLSQGCQDINECSDSSLNECEKQEYCLNTEGVYFCQCPIGYGGSAKRASPCFPTPNASKALTLGLSINLGSMLICIFGGGMYMLLKRRKEIRERENNFERNGGKLLEKQLLTSDSGIGGNKIFSKAELEKATDNFNDNRVLGHGGQGTVYKGMLSDGTIVAIKKSKKVDENQDQSIDQFVNEVVIMSKINHRNVVKLFGCCLETKVPLLVYEYVPNGTLDQHIYNHSSTEDFRITWKMRFQIAVDCAGVLAYLHSSSDTPTYHRDIKSSNILLDEKYRAKVSDFGISKNISIDQTHVTAAIQGTYGYLDPEYYQLGQFTDKSDVYSFGVVLLELLTSKRPTSTNKAFESQSLVAVLLQLMNDAPDEMYHILDTDVLQECSKDDTETLVKLTRRCLNMQGKERPTMKEVAMTLEMIKVRDDQAIASASLAAQSMKKPDGYEWSTDQIEITMGDGVPFTNSSTSASL